jgi:hypothetical protein
MTTLSLPITTIQKLDDLIEELRLKCESENIDFSSMYELKICHENQSYDCGGNCSGTCAGTCSDGCGDCGSSCGNTCVGSFQLCSLLI